MKSKRINDEEAKHDVKDLTHGLIVIDPIPDENDMVNILHFVGYWAEPNQQDVASLRKELGEDENFGFTETIDDLEILPAPDEIVKYYREMDLDE